jgi:hypothetical protein
MDESLLLMLGVYDSMRPPAPSIDALPRSPAVSVIDHGAIAPYHVDYITSKGAGKDVRNDKEE